MGMTLTSLHLWGLEKEALETQLGPGDLLREQNMPWLSMVPAQGSGPVECKRLAKRLTKERAEAAAVFA